MMTDRIRVIRPTFNLTLMWRSLAVIFFVFLLTACSPSERTPDRGVIRKAISFQIDRAQQELVQKLKLEKVPTWKIEKLSIWERQPIEIEYKPGFVVHGTYDITLDLPSQKVTRKNNLFEVYLQSQGEGKDWKLARPHPNPKKNGMDWETTSLEF